MCRGNESAHSMFTLRAEECVFLWSLFVPFIFRSQGRAVYAGHLWPLNSEGRKKKQMIDWLISFLIPYRQYSSHSLTMVNRRKKNQLNKWIKKERTTKQKYWDRYRYNLWVFCLNLTGQKRLQFVGLICSFFEILI